MLMWHQLGVKRMHMWHLANDGNLVKFFFWGGGSENWSFCQYMLEEFRSSINLRFLLCARVPLTHETLLESFGCYSSWFID